MGKDETSSRTQEAKVLKEDQPDSREEPKVTGAEKVCKTQEVNKNRCTDGEWSKEREDEFDEWYTSRGFGIRAKELNEEYQNKNNLRLEWEAEIAEREEDIRVFKSRCLKSKTQGSCVACDLQGELRCSSCTEVYCSVECHKKKGQCPNV